MNQQKGYVRDKRSPRPKNPHVSRVMSANRGSRTGPEEVFARLLRHLAGVSFSRYKRELPGKPDFSARTARVALFVNGCFWHRCPHCKLPLPKNNRAFWKEKFRKNVARDRRNTRKLRGLGYSVITLWECRLRKDSDREVKRVARILQHKNPRRK